MHPLIALLAVGIVFALSFTATLKVVQDDLSERPQKIAQLFLVWLLPVIGALIVWAVHRRPEKPLGRYREEEAQPPEDREPPGYTARTVQNIMDVIDGD